MNSRYIMVRWKNGKQHIYSGVKGWEKHFDALYIWTDAGEVLISLDDCKVYQRAYKKGWRELEL